MQHMRDVWVNWCEGEEKSYNICEFFEWKKSDRMEMIDQLAVVKVSEPLLVAIECSLIELPQQLLQTVYRQSYNRVRQERHVMDYGFIATNGERGIAVDTIGYETPIRKSRLIPRQEEQVCALVKHKAQESFGFKGELEDVNSTVMDKMIGLTRREKQRKQLAMMVLDQLFEEAELWEMRYWYTEFCPSKYDAIQLMSHDQAWTGLYNEMKAGWSKQHEEWTASIIKGQPFFEKLWTSYEDEERKKMSK
ncbi:DUF3603 family protein [Paenalkalicoccus suaedae]|uniref:DUF3603 family protein n=1 Tax=Paenalkalicoccus suaedae TaxID=2592382 RepID=A0A859FGJ8_9BACI|nr:DUF3603 family protein [Paenalkalicoccus suaedae]QKS71774.1 DUF3603 family protein [Paenalkalicoccus suaedae]